jgi:hypothetical protein
MDGVLAEEALRAGVGPGLPAAAYRELVRLATGSERVADEMTAAREFARADARAG